MNSYHKPSTTLRCSCHKGLTFPSLPKAVLILLKKQQLEKIKNSLVTLEDSQVPSLLNWERLE